MAGTSEVTIPDVALWTAPMAWAGQPLRDVPNYSRGFPSAATFVRGEAIFTVTEPLGEGMERQSEIAKPSLIRLEKGKPVDVHVPGLDGRCWTYRAVKTGKKMAWERLAGDRYPASEPAQPDDRFHIGFVVVQSILPADGTGKYISFRIAGDGNVEDFARTSDPDPRD